MIWCSCAWVANSHNCASLGYMYEFMLNQASKCEIIKDGFMVTLVAITAGAFVSLDLC